MRGLSADDFNADVRVIGVPGLIGPPTVSAPTLDSDGNRVTFQYSIPDLGKDVLSADSSVQISVRYFSQEAACAIVKVGPALIY